MHQMLSVTKLREICRVDAPLTRTIIDQLAELLQHSGKHDQHDTRLFATQTFYALLTQLLALHVVHLAVVDLAKDPASRSSSSISTTTLRQLGIHMPPVDERYSWYTEFGNEGLEQAIERLWQALQQFDWRVVDLAKDPGGAGSLARSTTTKPVDLLKPIYHRLIPRQVRHRRGEYYTPTWLAEHLLDMLEFPQSTATRLLDPACGSGTFLLAAIGRVRRRCQQKGLSPRETLARVTANVVGIDLDPLAVLAARANYLLAIADLLPEAAGPITIPVYQADSILDSVVDLAKDPAPPGSLARSTTGRFDCIAGNPPWVGWESLSEEYRERTRPLWEHYGLFAHSGMATILGAGKKDLSLLMSYSVTDRYLQEGGRLGFIITQSAFKTLGAGQGFRRFQWTHGKITTPVRLEQAADLTDFQPFEIAGTRTALFVWRKGEATTYPVPYHVWQKTSRGKSIAAEATLAEALSQTRQLEYEAQPIRPAEPTSAWLTTPAGIVSELERLWGASPYRAHEGANTGGANGVYWLEVLGEGGPGLTRVRNIVAGAKKRVRQVEAEIESELLHPLLRGREVRRWQGEPTAMLLMVQDPASRRGFEELKFAAEYPRGYAYLKSYEPMLRRRAAYRRYFTRTKNGSTRETGPFYCMFNIGPATFAAWKVVWHRMVAPIGAVVIGSQQGKPILPQETHAFVACDSEQEACYLAGLMNSTPFNYAALSFSQAGGKSFGSPQLLQHLQLPKFDEQREIHRRVAEIGRARSSGCGCSESFDQELDAAAADVWQIEAARLQVICQAMVELTKADLR